MKYYIPPTLEKDFRDWLATDVPHTTYTFELVRDWFRKGDADYEPVYLRAMYFSINWKSSATRS